MKTRNLTLMLLLLTVCWGQSWSADDTPLFNHNETSFPLDFTHALVDCETKFCRNTYLYIYIYIYIYKYITV